MGLVGAHRDGGHLRARGLTTLKAAEGGFGPPLEGCEAALDLLVEAVAAAGRVPGDEVACLPSTSPRNPLLRRPPLPSPRTARRARRGRARRPARGARRRLPARLGSRTGSPRTTGSGWARLSEDLGGRVQVVGDDLFTTNAVRLERGVEHGIANAVLVKMNQIGTVSETLAVIEQSRSAGYAPVVSARSG